MMRRQAYEWRAVVPDATWPTPYTLNLQPILSPNPVVPAVPGNLSADYDIFVGGYGTLLDIPAFIKATQFILLDELSCWPPASTVQPWVETTKYFQNPDGVVSDGLSGFTVPFLPTGIPGNGPLFYYPSFSLKDTPIYILPGQTWGVYWSCALNTNGVVSIPTQTGSVNVDYTIDNIIDVTTGDLIIPRVYVEFILFDGSDALIANRLIRRGEPVSVATVEAHKRALIRYKLMADMEDAKDEGIKRIPRKFA